MLKKNNMWFGIIIGAVLPIISYLIIELLLSLANNESFRESTQQVVSITANVFLFRMYMVKWHKDETGKGILLATLVYAAIFSYFIL
ncbi:MAG: hypothetical protein ACI8ZO_001091 [Flavobacteriales bacterium]|jgi:hypothetical protein